MSTWKFSFGVGSEPEPDHTEVSVASAFSAARGWGWLGTPALMNRDRGEPAAPLRTLVMCFEPATFRIATGPGLFRLRLCFGDQLWDNHAIQVAVDGAKGAIPLVRPRKSEFVTLSFTAVAAGPHLDIHFGSPTNNWIVNVLEVERLTAGAELPPPAAESRMLPRNHWMTLPEQTARGPQALVGRWRASPASRADVVPTGLGRAHYLAAMRASLGYFQGLQDASGAVIDPQLGEEFQYSTPCFAYAAALVAQEDRDMALAERAARAVDHAAPALAARAAATAHEDFYPAPLAHAIRLLGPLVDPSRLGRWRGVLGAMDPFATYRNKVGGLDGAGSNWNCLAAAGEFLLYQAGMRADASFTEWSVLGQGRFFSNEHGLYAEGPMTYDAFPRVWLMDMLEAGYAGPGAAGMGEALRRGALASLLMQSATGELPCGGRSAHHVWADALQVAMFEMGAAQAMRAGDRALAGTFKRAARRAFAAVQPWQRQSGEFQVVKNRAEPETRHGFENYSSHSQYNMLLLTALGFAYEHAAATENVAEWSTPAESGGHALVLERPFWKVTAAAGGTSVLVATRPESDQTPAGLLRVAFAGMPGLLGPSDGQPKKPGFHLPAGPRAAMSIGLAWEGTNGAVTSLADTAEKDLASEVEVLEEDPALTRFIVRWTVGEALRLEEHYTLSPGLVSVRYVLPVMPPGARLRWPVLAGDGVARTEIGVGAAVVRVRLGGAAVEYLLEGTEPPVVGDELLPHRNGFVRLAEARLREGATPRLAIRRAGGYL